MEQPPLPPEPQDVFSTVVTDALNQARQAVADIGLRVYRVWLIRERWPGPGRYEGADSPIEREWTEILPPPLVDHLSAARIAASGGIYQEGAVRLSKLNRRLRREQLIGREAFGHELPKNESFVIGLRASGQVFTELYTPASDAVLSPTDWTLTLNPINDRINGGPA